MLRTLELLFDIKKLIYIKAVKEGGLNRTPFHFHIGQQHGS